MAGDSLHIFGSSVFETMHLILVEPEREVDWFYSKDLGQRLKVVRISVVSNAALR